MTGAGLGCGPCGTEFPPNAKSCNESAVPELPGPVDRLVAAPCADLPDFLLTCGSKLLRTPARRGPRPGRCSAGNGQRCS